ncbi:hypothetical protein [Pantoea endophytica]
MRTLRKTRQSFVGSPFMVTERSLTDEHYADWRVFFDLLKHLFAEPGSPDAIKLWLCQGLNIALA